MYMPAVTPEIDYTASTLSALFHTDELTLTAELLTSDTRLSDYLNSSLSTVDVRPLQVRRNRTESSIDLDAPHAIMEKDHILFVIPVSEPSRMTMQGHHEWRQMTKLPCWASLGPYTLTGTIHLDSDRDPRVALRLLDKQFLPITDVKLTTVTGEERDYSAVIVNRTHLDMLALLSLGEARRRW
jgi:hypothetical protein